MDFKRFYAKKNITYYEKMYGPAIKNIVPFDAEKAKARHSHFYHEDMDMRPWKHHIVPFLLFGVMLMTVFGVPKPLVKVIDWILNIDPNATLPGLEDIEVAPFHKHLIKPKVKNSSNMIKSADAESKNELDSATNITTSAKRKRPGFRDKKVIAYENRIRDYSTPDKIFRYFATLKCIYDDEDSEIFMTPEDFVRSLTPGSMQPEGLGLDCFKRIDPKYNKTIKTQPSTSIFHIFGTRNIITFTDYVFLLVVLSTPRRQFELAFKMFDLNGDGELDIHEFNTVRNVIRGTTAIGKRHRDHGVTGSTLKKINSGLTTFFFGENLGKKLTVEKFLNFQESLQNELIRLEFENYNPAEENDKISEVNLADSLIMYAGFSEKKRQRYIKRVKTAFSGESSQGITFVDYMNLQKLLQNISDIDAALTFYHLAGTSINRETFKNVAFSVAHVALSDHIVDVIFKLFDENDDNELSNKEFVAVIKQRLLRGLDRQMDTGFVRLLNSLFQCTKEQIKFKPQTVEL